MKITKVEIEMTTKEREAFDKMIKSKACRELECKDCPLSSLNSGNGHSMCTLKYTNPVITTVDTPKPVLELSDGMDVSNIQTRRGDKVLFVAEGLGSFWCVIKDKINGILSFERYNSDGSWCFRGAIKGRPEQEDIVWKD